MMVGQYLVRLTDKIMCVPRWACRPILEAKNVDEAIGRG
jgi:hypothetical protein